MGKAAAEAVLNEKVNVGEYRNKDLKVKKIGRVLVTYHPAASFHNDYLVENIIQDFETAIDRVMGTEKKLDLDYQYREVLRLGHGEEWCNSEDFTEYSYLSLDLETDGLDCFLPKREIISFQLCNHEGIARYYPATPENMKALSTLIEICKDTGVTIVGQNHTRFDAKWLRKKAGIRLDSPRLKVFDCLIAAHLIDENRREKGLDVLAAAYTPLKGHKLDLKRYRKENGISFKDVPRKIMVPYACGDVDATTRLQPIFTKKMKEEGTYPLFKLQMKAAKLVSRMEYDGFKIDTTLIDKLADSYERKIEKDEKYLNSLVNSEVNCKSYKDVGYWLYDRWKLPAIGKPKNWRLPPVKNTAEDTLERLLGYVTSERKKAFIKTVLSLRSDHKILSNYILGLSDHLRQGSFIHSNFKLHGTVTGRWASDSLNLQNIPRSGPIKDLFISRYGERGAIIQVDLSQAELRHAAELANERTLTRIFDQGKIDVHTATAARVLKKDPSLVTKEERKKAKVINFGILYGGGDAKMAGEMGCTIREAALFKKLWKDEFSDWDSYVEEVKKYVLKNQYVRSKFGRVRHLPIISDNHEYLQRVFREAVNSPIQGGVSDITVYGGVSADKRIRLERIRPVHFVAEVHDSWILDTTIENVPIIVRILYETFRNQSFPEFKFKHRVKLECEVAVSKASKGQPASWGKVLTVNERGEYVEEED